MKNITVVVKFPNSDISIVEIMDLKLPELVNDIRLYTNDVYFVKEFLSAGTPKNVITPSESGLVVIDMVKFQILDSQGYTGIFKITPMEIKSSYQGNIVGETSESSIVKRFKDALLSGRLKGFEEWYDNGTQLNTSVLEMDTNDLMKIVESSKAYGQFVFDTSPYKVTTFSGTDAEDQHNLFEYLKIEGFIDQNSKLENEIWDDFLETLKA